MLKLPTTCPYGLNDFLRDDNIKDNIHILVRSKFYLLPRKPTKIPRVYDRFSDKFKFYLQNSHSNFPPFFRINLLAMKKINLKLTIILLQESLNDVNISL